MAGMPGKQEYTQRDPRADPRAGCRDVNSWSSIKLRTSVRTVWRILRPNEGRDYRPYMPALKEHWQHAHGLLEARNLKESV
jgi:hypothetical protein